MRAYGWNIGKPWTDFNENPTTTKSRGAKREQRVSFNHRELISYSTCVARYVGSKATKDLHVLVTARTYSVSTTSHVRSCTNWVSVPKFTVPHLYPDARDAIANFAHLMGKVADIRESAARNWNPERSWHARYVSEHWQEHLRDAYDHARLYAKLNKVSVKVPSLATLIDATETQRGISMQRYNEPKAAAKRLRIHARYVAKKALGLDRK